MGQRWSSRITASAPSALGMVEPDTDLTGNVLAFYALRPGVKALVLIPRDRSGFTITVSGPASAMWGFSW